MSKVKSFIKEVTARLKGDENGVIAAKNERKSASALNSQIASLKSKLVDDETRVEEAEEALDNAKYPTAVIVDNKVYVQIIVRAQEALDKAVEELNATEDSIAYWENIVEEFGVEVDA